MDEICTGTVGRERFHVENINALHLSKNFKTFETGCLFEIGRDSTGRSSRGKQIVFTFNLCVDVIVLVPRRTPESREGMSMRTFEGCQFAFFTRLWVPFLLSRTCNIV